LYKYANHVTQPGFYRNPNYIRI